MILYRPVGLQELQLIAEAGFQAFPPRLEWQPIFYPVLNFDYAKQIATQWNLDDPASGYAGFVTRFEVDDDFIARYEPQQVGGRQHIELWVPSDELDEFNRHIIGMITVEGAWYGERFAPDAVASLRQWLPSEPTPSTRGG